MRVKVCGITREEDVAAAVEAGADAVGFICGFPESPRNVSVERAKALIRTVPPFVDSVLVTKVSLVAKNPAMVRTTRPMTLQLYGPTGEAVSMSRRLGMKLILPHPVGRDGAGLCAMDGFDALLSDTYRKGMFGGTGETSDWRACRILREEIAPKPFILSGGLSQMNVEAAIEQVRPYAVDVSSGVELAPGVKDSAKVRAFVQTAKGVR